MPHKSWRAALPPVALCLTLSALIFAGIEFRQPAYLVDYRLNINPDSHHYVLLGRNFYLNGNYSRCEHPPYVPDMVKTPCYPLFAGGLEILGGAAGVYLGQAIINAASCWLVFAITRKFFGTRAAILAGFLFATDLMLAVFVFEALTEPLSNLLLLASVYLILGGLRTKTAAGGGVSRIAAGGLVLGLAIMTRPASLYVSVIAAAAILLADRRSPSLALRKVALLVGMAALPVAPWIARNYSVFSVPRLTHADAINLNYFVGAGAYQVEHKVSMERAQEMICREFSLFPFSVANNEFAVGLPVAELDARLRSTWPKVVFKYPRSLVISTITGLAKATISHCTADLAYLFHEEWSPPGTGGLIRLRPEALRRIGENGPVLVAAFGWQLLHTLSTLGLALVGLVLAVRDRRTRSIGLVLAAIVAYFYFTVALYGYDAYYRNRVPLMPFLEIFAGVGLAPWWARVSRRGHQRRRAVPGETGSV